jgi:AraC-like DNA-binding protein/mannose-6-phosphate isomerase-like protein (cupin superfamily)
MNYDLVIKDLDNWTENEEFLRDYYMAVADHQSVEKLILNTKADPLIITQALNPETIDTVLTEERFFSPGQNAMLMKHPRYNPFFTHRHTFFEMNYVLKGQCKEITDDRIVELKEGDLCLLAPNVTHGIKVYDDSIILNILIRYSTFLDIFLNTIRDKSQLSMFFTGNLYEKRKINYLLFHTKGDDVIRNYILDMYIEQLDADEYSDRIICSLMTIFFTQLTRRHGKNIESPDFHENPVEKSSEILNYIMNNFSTVTLRELADRFHYSVPYCSRMVKTISNMSFSELLTSIRLQQAENLLSHTLLSVSEISEKIGYKNPETFIRAFKKNYLLSPGQYRRNTISENKTN